VNKGRLVACRSSRLMRASVATGRHPRSGVRAGKLGGRAVRFSGAIREAMTDPKAQAEAKAVVASLSAAAQRAGKVGIVKALDDKHVAHELRRASTHASRAVGIARPQRRRRSFVLPLTATTSAAALAGAAYIGLNRRLAVHAPAVETEEQPTFASD
jgi:hypothetical protein